MNIIDHLILDDQIIGISPLYTKKDSDFSNYQLYRSFQYVFFIYTTHQSIEIKSDMFYPMGYGSDTNAANKEQSKIKTWSDEYFTIRAKIEMTIDNKQSFNLKSDYNASKDNSGQQPGLVG